MNLESTAIWIQEAKRAEQLRPVPHPREQRVVDRSDHWLMQLPMEGGAASAGVDHTASLASVYLQARESCSPQKASSQEQAFAMLAAMSWSRDEARDDAGRAWSSRLAPSAGGTHCIEPMLWWGESWYVASSGIVHQVRLSGALSEQLVGSVREAVYETEVTAALFAVADPRLLEQRYPGATSLMWRDAGAFLVVSSLVAQAIRCQGRIAGIGCLLDERTGAMAVGAFWFGGASVE